MALDIREGDFLIVNSVEYPIRSCAEWAWDGGNAIKRLLRVTATTKRKKAAKLTGIKCMPLDPVDPELRKRLDLDTPHELLQTVVDGSDVFYRLVLEDLKRG